jgi:hypothetical protein
MRMGRKQRLVLWTMLANGGWWPVDVRMSTSEREAARRLLQRGWLAMAFAEEGTALFIPQPKRADARKLVDAIRPVAR